MHPDVCVVIPRDMAQPLANVFVFLVTYLEEIKL
jgi:hypothetical protein